MFNIKNLALSLASITLLFGCADNQNQNLSDERNHGSIAITMYTDSTELFMEYPSLLVNDEEQFLIHLTDLKNFKAVTTGKLTLEFINEKSNKLTYSLGGPSRPGIYIPNVRFTKSGIYEMKISLRGNQVSDDIVVKDISVYSDHDQIPHDDEVETASIPFLKEQQWKIDFATNPVIKRKMQKSISVTGEITSKPEYYSKVVSPVSGVVLHKNNPSLKTLGSFVSKGSTLLHISPTSDKEAIVKKIYSDYLLSKSEYERAKKLFDKSAISQKRLDEAQYDFETKQISYLSLSDQIKITENGYSIIAPISGYLQSTNFSMGAQIESGEELFTIINPKKLILKANVPASRSEIAHSSIDAAFKVEGIETEYRISKLNGKKLSTGAMINSENRTIPVYFDFYNPNNIIKAGMYAETFIKIGKVEEYPSIPIEAIINEDGLEIAYIQLEGESFEKRILKTGIIDNGFVQIIEGLNLGERVVTEGAYQVRLAALAPESAIGHGHVH